jgi:Cu(I)-responsive transcriptional regulator
MKANASMNIGQAAAGSGVSAKMVRHYEALGLLGAVPRTGGGYRQYGARELHTLRFIRHARDLGFSMAEVTELLRLWANRSRASADVKRIALAHMAELDRKMAELAAMRGTLERLAACCHGDERPDCPILDELAQLPGPAGAGWNNAPRRRAAKESRS